MAITIKDVLELRQQIAAKRRELEEQERALAVVEAMLSGSPIPAIATKQERSPQLQFPVTPHKQTINELVVEAIEALGDYEFTVVDVENAIINAGKEITGNAPRARIAMALSALEGKGVVVRTYRGVGNVPHRFAKAGALVQQGADLI